MSTDLDPRAQLVLGASALLGFIYWLDSFGLEASYPFDVVIKAAGIVLLAVHALGRRAWLLALGLLLGALGDVFLALQPSMVALGIGAFGLGHLVYIGLFAREWRREGPRGRAGWVGVAVLAGFGLVMLTYLQPHFGALRVPASVYNGIIIVMACVAVGGRSPTLACAGALLFVVSDTVLALRMFAGQLAWAGPVVWATYYLGQAGIAVGLTEAGPRDGG